MLYILNWIMFLLYTTQAGYTLYILITFLKNWWCLSEKKRTRKYSMFSIMTLSLIFFNCLLAPLFLVIRYQYIQYTAINTVLVLSFMLLFSIFCLNSWLLYVIRYYRNHTLYKAGVLPEWDG